MSMPTHERCFGKGLGWEVSSCFATVAKPVGVCTLVYCSLRSCCAV